jgi:hypothetical protein
MAEKEVRTITDKQEIDNILQDKIKNRKLIFTDWYKIGILRKGIPEEKFDEVFPQFDKVCTIEIEELKKGDIGYELFYKLSGNITISIATIPKEKDLLIIHLIEYKRNLDYRFKKFKQ